MCPYCHQTPCVFTSGKITDAPLSIEDWQIIYQFMQEVYLPFIHEILYRAEMRQKENYVKPH